MKDLFGSDSEGDGDDDDLDAPDIVTNNFDEEPKKPKGEVLALSLAKLPRWKEETNMVQTTPSMDESPSM